MAKDQRSLRALDVLIDCADHSTRYVVLSANGFFGADVVVPYSAVWRVDDDVHLALTGREVAALPHFDLYTHCHVGGLYSRSAWRYGAARPLTPRSRPRPGAVR